VDMLKDGVVGKVIRGCGCGWCRWRGCHWEEAPMLGACVV
jgi:hypothetical protein